MEWAAMEGHWSLTPSNWDPTTMTSSAPFSPAIRCRTAPWSNGRLTSLARSGDYGGLWQCFESPTWMGGIFPQHINTKILR